MVDHQEKRLLQAILIALPAVIIALVVMGPSPAQAQLDCLDVCGDVLSDCHVRLHK